MEDEILHEILILFYKSEAEERQRNHDLWDN